MKSVEDYFDEKLVDILDEDWERWDTKYMPDIDNIGSIDYHDISHDHFIGVDE